MITLTLLLIKYINPRALDIVPEKDINLCLFWLTFFYAIGLDIGLIAGLTTFPFLLIFESLCLLTLLMLRELGVLGMKAEISITKLLFFTPVIRILYIVIRSLTQAMHLGFKKLYHNCQPAAVDCKQSDSTTNSNFLKLKKDVHQDATSSDLTTNYSSQSPRVFLL